jgi:hypothetical protein
VRPFSDVAIALSSLGADCVTNARLKERRKKRVVSTSTDERVKVKSRGAETKGPTQWRTDSESREQSAEGGTERAANRDQVAESREQRAEGREQRTESRE